MESPIKVAIFGAGGFAKEVAWLISSHRGENLFDFIGHIEDGAKDGDTANGRPVMSWTSFSEQPHSKGCLITVAVGNPRTRREMVAKCEAEGFKFVTLVHRSVQLSEFVELGVGSIVCCGSILTVNIKIEEHVHINLGCTIGHDVRIGKFTTLSPGVHVSGNVHIGESVYIGTGASIINGTTENPLVIADGTVVGAGACVTRSTEAHSLYAGVPAQFKKRYL